MTLPNSTTDVTDLNKATGIVTTASRAGTLKAGDTVTFTLETETTVTVTGAPWLTLSNGATATYAGLDGEGTRDLHLYDRGRGGRREPHRHRPRTQWRIAGQARPASASWRHRM